MDHIGLYLLVITFLVITYTFGRVLGFTQVEKMCQLIHKKVK